jgi:hypothetical protein
MYIKAQDGGFYLKSIDASDVTIYETTKEPPQIVGYRRELKEEWMEWFVYVNHIWKYNIVIPPNSITRNFRLR